jgi:hypothetical protein
VLLEVKYGKINLERPGNITGGGNRYSAEQEVYVIQVQEEAGSVPKGRKG